MGRRKMTIDDHASSSEGHASTGNGSQATGNKMDAVRAALSELGKKAKPAKIRDFILERFGFEMKSNMISAYKSMLAKRRGKRGRPPGRRPRAEAESADTGARSAASSTSSKDIFKDIRTLKELTDRLGAHRIRELLEMMGH